MRNGEKPVNKAKQLSNQAIDILKKFGIDPREALWDCHGQYIIYHRYLEQIALKAGIKFGFPTVLETNQEKKSCAILVEGWFVKEQKDSSGPALSVWTVGEAAPYNNKNSYPFAMAEKRAKDRLILKLIGLHGEVYSEDEADDFKPKKEAKPRVKKDAKYFDDLCAYVVKNLKSSDCIEMVDQIIDVNSDDLNKMNSEQRVSVRKVLNAKRDELAKEGEAA